MECGRTRGSGVLAVALAAAVTFTGCRRTEPRPATRPTRRPAPASRPAAPDAGGRSPAQVRKRGNHLKGQRSLYLRQHAHNPVDWYPWGEAALKRARATGRPIFLSVGYASCHWCHVMEREVFEKDDVARMLNANFICIKVDREERPDIDAVYMTAVQALSGNGGWPMSVFLTPDLKPFFGGTYFSRATFVKLLGRLLHAYRNQRPKLLKVAGQLHRAISTNRLSRSSGSVDEGLLEETANRATLDFDEQWGGRRGRMKFPTPLRWMTLLRRHRKTGHRRLAQVVRRTLDKMASGGMQDHLAGGFHRYSVDRRWLVPHFEKMLYDNALLASLYLEAAVVLGEPRHGRVAQATLDFLVTRMQDRTGGTPRGLYASIDADSGGVEGAFYTWTPAELTAVTGARDGPALSALLGVTARGDVDGRSVITRRAAPGEVARSLGRPLAEVSRLLARWRPRLLAARLKRTRPTLDRKIVTAWNGLAISALARGAAALGEPRYAAAAAGAARFLWKNHRRKDGRLFRVSNAGVAEHAGVLDDHAFFARGLLDLYRATGKRQHLRRALALLKIVRTDYGATPACFHLTGVGQEAPMGRQIRGLDHARPSGLAVALHALVSAGVLTGKQAYLDDARRCLAAQRTMIKRLGYEMAWSLDVAQRLRGPLYEVIVAGAPGAAKTRALVSAFNKLLPAHAVLARVPAAGPDAATLTLLPPAENKQALGGRPTAYVCVRGSCKRPVHTAAALRRQLLQGWRR